MRALLIVGLIWVSGSGLAIVVRAEPAPRCPEGRALDGGCVKSGLAEEMRVGAVVLSQPKLSLTNPPVLPGDDGTYDVPRDNREIRNLHGVPPITDATGDVRSLGPRRTIPVGPRS